MTVSATWDAIKSTKCLHYGCCIFTTRHMISQIVLYCERLLSLPTPGANVSESERIYKVVSTRPLHEQDRNLPILYRSLSTSGIFLV